MPADIHAIPPEILAAIFVMGVHTWEIQFVSTLSRVCQDWKSVVDNTPRLWGVIFISSRSSPGVLEKQLAKAKASPLSLWVLPCAQAIQLNRVRKQLFALSANWVEADVGTAFLCESGTGWNALRHNLQRLTLCRGHSTSDDPGSFFEDSTDISHRQPSLHTFYSLSLPVAWTRGFLGPWIKHFYLRQSGKGQKITDTWEYLARIPNAKTISLYQVQHVEHPDEVLQPPCTIVLAKLRDLKFRRVKFSSVVLAAIAAPSLQTLSIDEASESVWGSPSSMSSCFTQWIQPSHTPAHLHTLELIDTLKSGDIPYLIRFLRLLPNLVRLLITDDEVGRATASTSTSSNGKVKLYYALAYPYVNEDGGSTSSAWLCPSLMILYLDTAPELTELIPIARSRGGIAPFTAGIPPPARLRRLESNLCPVDLDELNELKCSIDEVNCICLHCGLTIEDDSQ
ncbi:hypothetical protein M413DRAFT_442980 [Hebeloma cylindrosporum]|uniref:Uncharacterized protein n=1 Tax=Hebeloma cylindrosporum TaxID=76867 RepID=A0A0C3CIE9_HEBCY|nr:hypothetical protein M413DRAFT_442980 [Hebeloma cylindrosporum h7]